VVAGAVHELGSEVVVVFNVSGQPNARAAQPCPAVLPVQVVALRLTPVAPRAPRAADRWLTGLRLEELKSVLVHSEHADPEGAALRGSPP